MSLIGKIVGGAAGYALGGPIGALLGALAGHAYDHMAARPAPLEDEAAATRNVAFTIGVIALAAKMAKADGHVVDAEVRAFREMYDVDPGEEENVRRFFDQARRTAAGFEAYAQQIAGLFRPGSPVLEELMGGLLHIAHADGVLHEAERTYIARVAEIFGFDAIAYARIRASHVRDEACAPCRVLGVPEDADEATAKAAYRRLARENHPDRLIAEGMPAEFVALANEKMAAINEAYEAMRRDRGWT